MITGGARSGKSRYAQQRALELTATPLYVATARHWGGDFEDRIKRHQQDRHEGWVSLEEEKNVASLELTNAVAVVDCVTLWLTNYFIDYKYDVERSLHDFKEQVDSLAAIEGTLFIVTNEIGMSVHPEGEISRKFVDLQGWANQYLAAKAREVVLMVSGVPMVVKGNG
jgi:adenosylcobinamide kinase/adenosylcobinamide-phosphate guanylyltransferase